MNIMDFESFLDEMDNDYEVVNLVVNEFINSLDTQIFDMDLLLKSKNYTVLSREAHSIKGGARNLMAYRLEESAKNLEESVISQDPILISNNISRVIEEVEVFKNYINTMPMPIVGAMS